MKKEIYRKGDRVDIQELKSMVLKSNLDTTIKCDFVDYISVGKDDAVAALRCLVYDFFNAENAIENSKKCNNIVDWVHNVADNLSPELSNYSKRQIDLVMALIIYEQSVRDVSYNDILSKFVEVHRSEGGVY